MNRNQLLAEAPTIIQRMIARGLIHPPDKSTFVRPLHFSGDWKRKARGEAKPKPCSYCGKENGWHYKGCDRPRPDAKTMCGWCGMSGGRHTKNCKNPIV